MAYTVPGPTTPAEIATWQGFLQASGLPRSVWSQGLTNSIVVVSGPATLYGASILNTKATAQFILVFDATALPAEGTVPTQPYTVSGTSNLGLYFGSTGRFFEQGIVLCNSSTSATKTIGAADCWFDVQYI